MELKVETEVSPVEKNVSTKDINVGVPVYVPKKWFERRNCKKLRIMLILLPDDVESEVDLNNVELSKKLVENSVEVGIVKDTE